MSTTVKNRAAKGKRDFVGITRSDVAGSGRVVIRLNQLTQLVIVVFMLIKTVGVSCLKAFELLTERCYYL